MVNKNSEEWIGNQSWICFQNQNSCFKTCFKNILNRFWNYTLFQIIFHTLKLHLICPKTQIHMFQNLISWSKIIRFQTISDMFQSLIFCKYHNHTLCFKNRSYVSSPYFMFQDHIICFKTIFHISKLYIMCFNAIFHRSFIKYSKPEELKHEWILCKNMQSSWRFYL